MEEATVMMVGLEWNRIKEGLDILAAQERAAGKQITRLVHDYSAPNVSEKIVRIILSYTDYVNRVVWYKPAP